MKYFLIYSNIKIYVFIIAKPSKDGINKLPTFTLKSMVLCCNRNNINFCISMRAMYHRILYLKYAINDLKKIAKLVNSFLHKFIITYKII